MIEVAPGLYVGSQADFEAICKAQGNPHPHPGDRIRDWTVVHACKEPHHRAALGYTGRGAPKEHEEYLFARRDHRMMLNLVDVDDPAYIRPEIVLEAVGFIANGLNNGNVLVHCNQGHSRGPSIAFAYLARSGLFDGETFGAAEEAFKELYPDYAPARGMREFMRAHWSELRQ